MSDQAPPNEKTKRCPKCAEHVQIAAKTCKHCGADLRNWPSRHPILATFAALFLITMFVNLVSGEKSSSDTTAPQETSGQSAGQTAAQAEADKSRAEQAQLLKDIEVVSASIGSDIIGTSELRVKLRNKTDKTIDAVDIEAYFFNNYDEPVGEWGLRKAEAYGGTIQRETIRPGATYDAVFNLAVYQGVTKVKNVKVTRAHFTDGTEASIE